MSWNLGTLTLIRLTWRIWWAPNTASKWQMGFNSAFKGLTSWEPVGHSRPVTGLLYILIKPLEYHHFLSHTLTFMYRGSTDFKPHLKQRFLTAACWWFVILHQTSKKNRDTNQIQELIKKRQIKKSVKENFLVISVYVLAIRWAAFLVYMIQEQRNCLLVRVWLSDFNSKDNGIEKMQHCASCKVAVVYHSQ